MSTAQLLISALESMADEIRGFYHRPSDVMVTIVVRAPWVPDGDVVITNEADHTDAILAIEMYGNAKDASA